MKDAQFELKSKFNLLHAAQNYVDFLRSSIDVEKKIAAQEANDLIIYNFNKLLLRVMQWMSIRAPLTSRMNSKYMRLKRLRNLRTSMNLLPRSLTEMLQELKNDSKFDLNYPKLNIRNMDFVSSFSFLPRILDLLEKPDLLF